MKRCVFFDRDGVINHLIFYQNRGYYDSPQSPEDVRLIEGIADIILWTNQHNITVVEASNQPGVAKGKMSQETSNLIEDRIHHLLKEKGAIINKVYICPHHPKGVVPELTKVCDCRKPAPGLLLKAAQELNLDLKHSIILGDKASDIETGKAAGIKTIIYLHKEDTPEKVEEAKKAEADYKVSSLKKITPILKDIFRI
jgi:D-glycero-D-manno-heptose 1,7-bisphosphate phosphatase